MKKSIKEELEQHIINIINNQFSNQLDETAEGVDLHNVAFNEDYYIIGYHNANEWLQKHGLDAFEVIHDVFEYHNEVFGEINIKNTDVNAEWVVNQLVYFYGQELIDSDKTLSEYL